MLKKSTRKISPMAQAAVKHYIELSESLNHSEGCAEVSAGRRRAQAILLEQAFPTQRDEDWQYTKLVNFAQKRFDHTLQDTLDLSAIQHFLPPLMPCFDAIKLIFVDGVFNVSLSDDVSNLPQGLSIQLTRDVLKNPDAAKKWFGQEALIHGEAFGVLNSALLEEGVTLQVAKNATIETPVLVLNVQTQSNHISTLTNQVQLAQNAELTLIQQFVSCGDIDACSNVVTVIDVAESSRMRQVVLQQQSSLGYYFHNQFVFQADKSDFNTFYAGMGCQLSRHQNHLFMNGDHIESSQNSACLANQTQVVDSRTNTQHNQEWGASQQLHKYVLADSAVGVFNGMIRVDRQAQKTDGQMDNKNLLLSNLAKMNSKPQLEIYADDVKCSHGSATGQINHDQIFYLQARGIPRNQAIEMITKAFLMEPVETINRTEIKTWVGNVLSTALLSGGYFAGGSE